MKRSRENKKRLTIGAETVRSLGAQQLGGVAAGYPTFTQKAGACTVGTYGSCPDYCCTCMCG